MCELGELDNNVRIKNAKCKVAKLTDLPDATETVAHGGQIGLKVFI